MKLVVKNLTSQRSGREVSNQFEIRLETRTKLVYQFQSYSTTIAKIVYRRGEGYTSDRRIYLDNNALDYSRTTSKYLYYWLGFGRKEIQDRIKNKMIILTDLNK